MGARRAATGSLCLSAMLALAAIGSARAAELAGSALVSALRHGGYVLVLRHASSPFELPDKSAADPANVNLERQLDATGSAFRSARSIRARRFARCRRRSTPTYPIQPPSLN